MTPLGPPTSQSVTTSRKENKPAPDTALHVQRAPQGFQAKGRRASPALRAPPRPFRWPGVPGGGARASDEAGGLGCGRRARSPGGRDPGGGGGGGAPSAAPRAPIAALPPRVGPRPRALGRCLEARGSDSVSQQSLSPSLQPDWRPKRPGSPGRGRSAAAAGEGGKRAREGRVAGDRVPAAGLTRVPTAATRGWGTGSSENKPKMGNGEARAALRGVLSRCLGQKTALASRNSSRWWLFSFSPSEMRLCLRVEGRPLRGSECAATPGPALARGTLFPAPPVFPVPPPGPQSPPWAPTPLRTGAGAWACCPRPAGCLGLLSLGRV